MGRDVASGVLLFTGSLVCLLVMSLHPTGHDLMDGERAEQQARLAVLVHGAALAALPLLFLGLLGLTRRLGPSELATSALVVHGFGAAAVMSAAVASGFVATELARDLRAAGAGSVDTLHALLEYTHHWNQAFAKVHVVASSVAMLLWSAAILRSRRLARGAGIVGAVVGSVIPLLLLAGHLHLDVHGFGLVVLGQAAWQILIGILLCRPSTPRAA